jgi:hypothetical protein
MFRKITFIALLAVVTLASCKKQKEKTTQEKISGKWNIVSIVDNDYYSGSSHVTTYTGTASDYLDFKNDGTVFVSFTGITNNSNYGLIGDTKIWIENDNYDIKTLTDNQFVLYSKDSYGSDYYESTMTLKR